MESKIDLDADKMLREVYNANHSQKGGIGYGYMYDTEGNQYDSRTGSYLAKILHEHKLIRWMGYPDDPTKDMLYLEPRGEDIQNNGGWIQHLNRLRNNRREKLLDQEVNKKEYKKHFELTSRIRTPAFEEKRESWLAKYWWMFIIPLLVGIILLFIEHNLFSK